MPASPKFCQARWIFQGNTREFVSPLTRSVQVLELLGARWMASFTLPPMKRTTAEVWCAWLTSLEGRQGRFYAGPPDATSPRGTATGTPLVKSASQTGIYLITDGWTNSVTGILKSGDYISWDTPSGWRELHLLVEDANSDGSGNATLTLSPPIRESPADNAQVIISSPTCVMCLATDDEARWDVVGGAMIYGLAFNAEEAFRATT